MSQPTHPLIEQLRRLAGGQDWIGIVSLQNEIDQYAGPDQAWALFTLGRAYWNLARNPWDFAQSVRYGRAAAALDPLGGRAPKVLGVRLITLGYYPEGTRVLQGWLGRFRQWDPATQQCLSQVQYTLGYAARYQGQYQQAELWYREAIATFDAAGNHEWVYLTTCSLAQVYARMGSPTQARAILASVPVGDSFEPYRLKALVEILAAEGNRGAALVIGEDASAALATLQGQDDDPWELAELHMLLANLQSQAGNLVERDKHLEVVDAALRQSPRHDLYTQARLLLDLDGKEVAV